MIRSRRTVLLFVSAALAAAISMIGGVDASAKPLPQEGGAPSADRARPAGANLQARVKRVRVVAQQAPTASCVVTEIAATTEKKGIDPKLKKLEAKLTKPPFTAWDTFKLLAEPQVQAVKDKPTTQKLATKGLLTLVFKDKLVSQGGRPRLRLSVDMDSASGTRTVSTVIVFDSGDSVLFAGEPYDKGTYILALSCTAQ